VIYRLQEKNAIEDDVSLFQAVNHDNKQSLVHKLGDNSVSGLSFACWGEETT
jgi:hypothetical protein